MPPFDEQNATGWRAPGSLKPAMNRGNPLPTLDNTQSEAHS